MEKVSAKISEPYPKLKSCVHRGYRLLEYDRILILLRFGAWRLDSHPEELWFREFCMRKRAAARTVATAHSIKPREPPESFLFGFSGPGGLGGRLLERLGDLIAT